jgi:hypothetical protein
VNQRREIQTLSGALQRTVVLLKKCGEKRWAFKLEGYLEQLNGGNLGAIDQLLGTYGGMGSFNDLYLCPHNGHQLTLTETPVINERLNKLGHQMWEAATQLRRQLDRDSVTNGSST